MKRFTTDSHARVARVFALAFALAFAILVASCTHDFAPFSEPPQTSDAGVDAGRAGDAAPVDANEKF